MENEEVKVEGEMLPEAEVTVEETPVVAEEVAAEVAPEVVAEEVL